MRVTRFEFSVLLSGNLLLLGILIYGIMLLGVICLLIGLFWAIPTVGVALTFVYRKLIAHADSLAPEVAASSPSGSGLGASQDTM